ncbi:MAG: PTS sugar transporter subunit IIA [Erysipelotrichaceae bacterium]|nr:PTS sugar transporter subunit IIA [Erysipelotrichaceae bacterium]
MKTNNIKKMTEYLANKSDWCTAKELSQYLHTTTRTIQNYVRELNHNNNLIISSQEGYRWNPAQNYRKDIRNEIVADTPERRLAQILKQLLFYGESSFLEIMDEFFISDKTLESDLLRVKNELATFHCRLRRKDDNLWISGSENNLRPLIYHCIRLNHPASVIAREDVKEEFPDYDLDFIVEKIDQAVASQDLQFTGINYYYFITVICIQLSRISQGQTVTETILSADTLEAFREKKAAREIAAAFETRFAVSYSLQEEHYLESILISFCLPASAVPLCALSEVPELLPFLREDLAFLSSRIKNDITTPMALNRISHLVQRMVLRKRCGIIYPNPLSYNIRKAVPFLESYVIWLCNDLADRYQIDIGSDDISLITMAIQQYVTREYRHNAFHATLLCPQYNNIDREIRQKITQRLGDSLIIDRTLNRVDGELLNNDLILSTYPISRHSGITVISPFIDDDDIYKITNAIHNKKTNIYIDELLDVFHKYLQPEHFQMNVPVTSRHRILSEISEAFLKEGTIQQRDMNSLLRRERTAPTSFNNLVAIPHVTSTTATTANLHIILNRDPFKWDVNKINLLICAIWPRSMLEQMQSFYYICTKLLSSPLIIQRLLQAADMSSFLSLLETMKK